MVENPLKISEAGIPLKLLIGTPELSYIFLYI
jgi:hypothetical protein